MDSRNAILWATLLWLPTTLLATITIIHIDPTTGNDNITCGDVMTPCKTIESSWMTYLWSSNISGHIIFSLKPGNYLVDRDHRHPLSYKCSERYITSLDVQLDRNGDPNNNTYAEVHHSFEITSCQISFTGIEFYTSNITTIDSNITIEQCNIQNTDSTLNFSKSALISVTHVTFTNLTSMSQILVSRSEIVSFSNCLFRFIRIGTNVKKFIDIDTVRTLTLRNIEILHNSGLQNTLPNSQILKFCSIQNVRTMNMVSVSVKKNTNLVFEISKKTTLVADAWKISENINTTLVLNDTIANISNLVLHRNFRTIGKWESVLLFDGGIIRIEGLDMKCLHEKRRRQLGSSVVASSKTHLECINCTTQYCNKLCSVGFESVQEILCKECPIGTSAHEWEKTCKKCHRGYYSPKTGLSDCIQCKKGTYCDKRGCSQCTKCTNDLFTSLSGSSTCSQMSLLFIILLGVTIFLIMGPVAIKVIKNKQRGERNGNDGYDNSLFNDSNNDNDNSRQRNDSNLTESENYRSSINQS